MDRMHTTISSSLVAGLAQRQCISLDQRCYCTSGLVLWMDGWPSWNG